MYVLISNHLIINIIDIININVIYKTHTGAIRFNFIQDLLAYSFEERLPSKCPST